jgi:hypothetical protein
MRLKVEEMTFKEYILFKNPIGSSARVRSFVIGFGLDENSDLSGIHGLGKKGRSAITKLQIKYKRRYNK